jgi:hypothetical protein
MYKDRYKCVSYLHGNASKREIISNRKCDLFSCSGGRIGVLISPWPDQEGNKIREKILIFIYLTYNHNWRNISTLVSGFHRAL